MSLNNTTPEEVTSLAKQLPTSDQISHWSEERRETFVSTFDARVRVAQYILTQTAFFVHQKALEKQFISSKRNGDGELCNLGNANEYRDKQPGAVRDSGNYYQSASHLLDTVGGRTMSELNQVAKDRAESILENLPPLKVAVRILSPDIADKIEEKEKLLEQGQKLKDELEDIAGPVALEDFPEQMTIGKVRAELKAREDKRVSLLRQLDDIGTQGLSLDHKINKFLYAGLPGLSDAVLKVITDSRERATAFGAMNRRVGEQIRFGDSETALQMLKSFEQDEVTVSANVKADFDAALERLKLAAKKVGTKKAKALKSKG